MNADRSPIEALDAAPLSSVRRTIVRTLMRSYPRGVEADAILAEVYNATNEPEHARTALTVQMANLRHILRPYGWTIPPAGGGRGNHGSYRLEPLP